MTDRQIDDAIDGAVRDLMDVDADPAFRARVLSRLDRPARHGSRFRFAAVSASVAAVVLALLLTREREPVSPPPSLARNAPAAVSLPVGPEPPLPAAGQRTPVLPPKAVAGNRFRLGPGGASSPRPDPTHVVAPGAIVAAVADPSGGDVLDLLATIEPIGMTPILNVPIAVSEIVLAPLTPVADLEMAPFDPRRERD